MFITSLSLHGPFFISSCLCDQNCHGVHAITSGTPSLVSIPIFERRFASIKEFPDNLCQMELRWLQKFALLPDEIFQYHKSQIPWRSFGSKVHKINMNSECNLTFFLQTTSTSNLKRNRRYRKCPMGACWNTAVGLDPLLLLYMEGRQMDRKGKLIEKLLPSCC